MKLCSTRCRPASTRAATSTAHFLVRLRVAHPLLALAGTLVVIAAAASVLRARREPAVRRNAWALAALVLLQLALGLANLLLLAPVAMQIAHLLLADLVWIALVLLSARALS